MYVVTTFIHMIQQENVQGINTLGLFEGNNRRRCQAIQGIKQINSAGSASPAARTLAPRFSDVSGVGSIIFFFSAGVAALCVAFGVRGYSSTFGRFGDCWPPSRRATGHVQILKGPEMGIGAL